MFYSNLKRRKCVWIALRWIINLNVQGFSKRKKFGIWCVFHFCSHCMLSIFFDGAFGVHWQANKTKTPKQKKDNGFMVLGDEANEWKAIGYERVYALDCLLYAMPRSNCQFLIMQKFFFFFFFFVFLFCSICLNDRHRNRGTLWLVIVWALKLVLLLVWLPSAILNCVFVNLWPYFKATSLCIWMPLEIRNWKLKTGIAVRYEKLKEHYSSCRSVVTSNYREAMFIPLLTRTPQ